MSPLLARVLHMLGRARITVVDDTQPIQTIQVQTAIPDAAGGAAIIDGVPHLQPYGLASNPPLQSETLLARLFGNRTQSIAIGAHHPSRLKGLSPGDSALYDQRGAYVWLTPQGLVIDGHGLPATIRNVGALTLEGDLIVTGKVMVTGIVSSDMGVTVGTTPLTVP